MSDEVPLERPSPALLPTHDRINRALALAHLNGLRGWSPSAGGASDEVGGVHRRALDLAEPGAFGYFSTPVD